MMCFSFDICHLQNETDWLTTMPTGHQLPAMSPAHDTHTHTKTNEINIVTADLFRYLNNKITQCLIPVCDTFLIALSHLLTTNCLL